MILYLLAIFLFLIGIIGVIIKRNLIKIIISLTICEYSLFLLLALIGYKKGALAPIITAGTKKFNFVDPLPQALVLTAIVIGLGTTALLAAIATRLYEKYKSFDIKEMRKLKG
jgi:multisubunit Na+/H+ antiporter MnhC subunit